MEIVEHVDNLKLFYQSCVNLLNKNELIFFEITDIININIIT